MVTVLSKTCRRSNIYNYKLYIIHIRRVDDDHWVMLDSMIDRREDGSLPLMRVDIPWEAVRGTVMLLEEETEIPLHDPPHAYIISPEDT